MKKTNNRLLYLTFFFGFIFIIFLMNRFSGNFTQAKPKLLLPQLVNEKVEEISLKTDGKITLIINKNNQWLVKNDVVFFPADKQLITQIIDGYKNAIQDKIVSNNKKYHAQYGIGETLIELKTNVKKYPLYIGSPINPDENYLRLDKENQVFIGSGFSFIASTPDFRDLSLHLVNNENSLDQIEVTYGNTKFLLVKKNNNWFIDNQKAKKEAVDFFVNDLRTLKGNQIEKENTALAYPYYTAILTEKKVVKKLTIAKKDAENYNAQVSGNEFTYTLPEAYVKSIEKTVTDLLGK